MARLRSNFQNGFLGTGLTSVAQGTVQAVTGLFAVAPTFATIVPPDIVVLVIEPTTAGQQEIVYLEAYTEGSLDGTIVRGQEGTLAPAHGAGKAWGHDPTALDYAALVGSALSGDVVTIDGTGESGTVTLTAITGDFSINALAFHGNLFLSGRLVTGPAPSYGVEFQDAALGGHLLAALANGLNYDGTYLPLGLLGKAAIVVDYTVPPGLVAVPGLSVTATVGAGRALEVAFQGIAFNGAATPANVVAAVIKRDGTQIGELSAVFGSASGTPGDTVTFGGVILDEPGAGAHTWTVEAQYNNTGGSLIATATAPCTLTVKDVGGA
jgi:hypothetical protein